MKNRKIYILFFVTLSLILIIVAYWVFPTSFNKIRPEDVHEIVLRSGTTGARVTITDSDDINNIVGIISSCDLKKDRLCIGRIGYVIRADISLNSGRTVGFYINGANRVEKGIIAYSTVDSEIEFESLRSYLN